jgi:LDH2 family malate/lactate/ureidoglycolate dehydrogenase
VSESARYRADDLRKFCCAALQASEAPPLDAEEASESLVAARPITRVVQQPGNSALFDGDNGLGPVVGARAMELGESLVLAFPNAADTMDLVESPA